MTRRASHCGSRSSAFASRGNSCGASRELARIGPHRIDRRADRQRLAVAVDDHAAVRRELAPRAGSARRPAAQELLVDELQVDGARRAAHARRRRRARRSTSQWRQRWRPRRCGRSVRAAAHGCTMRRSLACGMTMCSSSRATLSTRACVAQVLCSSCSWPHSMSSSSRSRVRRSSSTNSCAPRACRRPRRARRRARATPQQPRRRSASRRCSCGEPLGHAQHGAARARIAPRLPLRDACLRAADAAAAADARAAAPAAGPRTPDRPAPRAG